MTSIHFHYATDGGCSFHRALQPVRFCHKELAERDIILTTGNEINGQDWLVFHSLPANSNTLHEVLRLKRKGVKLCWSLDDDLAAIPDWNPAKIGEDGMVVFDIMARAADAVIVSTHQLNLTVFESMFDNAKLKTLKAIHTCPNLLDLSTFPESPYDGASFADTTVKWPIRFVWAGSATHKGDVMVMEDALIRLLEKHGPNLVAVIFAGSMPPSELLRRRLHHGCITAGSVPFNQYRKMANSLDPDVWLAPLADIPFNLSKSHLRIMEGWALGACVVASPVGEYNRVKSGDDGLLVVDNDPEMWFKALDRLVLDHQTRVQIAANGRSRARHECDWNVAANRKPWIDALQAIAGM